MASIVAERFPDGVWFVDLSSLSGSQFVSDKVATMLGVSETGSGSALSQAIGRHLAPRSALVVLDNCEHLVEAAAEVAAGLLAAAPELRVVATSREPLGIGGEVTWVVPPLTEDATDLARSGALTVGAGLWQPGWRQPARPSGRPQEAESRVHDAPSLA